MNLLITTQAVDRDDPVLGFFHGWLIALAPYFECVHVICLREGVHNLPLHVHVHSLGKECGENRMRYVYRLMRYAWQYRHEYDVVFSHMNPHYIVLLGWLWKLLGKTMFFWRNHARMNVMTRIAAFFAKRVYYTSPFACTRIFRHARQMPVGIDTQLFRPIDGVVRSVRSCLFLGRLSPVKRPELFLEACRHAPDHTVDVYGNDPKGKDGSYERALKVSAPKFVRFHDAVKNYETPELYSKTEVYVNLTQEGSMDKTVLEAAACGALVLVSNTSFKDDIPSPCMLKDSTPEHIASSLAALYNLPRETKDIFRKELIETVEEKHSLSKLVVLLKYEMEHYHTH